MTTRKSNPTDRCIVPHLQLAGSRRQELVENAGANRIQVQHRLHFSICVFQERMFIPCRLPSEPVRVGGFKAAAAKAR